MGIATHRRIAHFKALESIIYQQRSGISIKKLFCLKRINYIYAVCFKHLEYPSNDLIIPLGTKPQLSYCLKRLTAQG